VRRGPDLAPVGDIGIGRGGSPRRAPATNEQINTAIRAAAHQATNRVDLDGVTLDEMFR
jgi:hypothetical protein